MKLLKHQNIIIYNMKDDKYSFWSVRQQIRPLEEMSVSNLNISVRADKEVKYHLLILYIYMSSMSNPSGRVCWVVMLPHHYSPASDQGAVESLGNRWDGVQLYMACVRGRLVLAYSLLTDRLTHTNRKTAVSMHFLCFVCVCVCVNVRIFILQYNVDAYMFNKSNKCVCTHTHQIYNT